MKTPPNLEVFNSVGGAAFFEQMIAYWETQGGRIDRIHALDERSYRQPRGLLGKAILRWQMYVAYAFKCWRLARSSAAPIRVVTTNPFFAPALVQSAAGARGTTIHLAYDLFPDALEQAGVLRPGSWLSRRCESVTRAALRECAVTVFLGERLRRHAEARYGAARRSVVIPVGADGRAFRSRPPVPPAPEQGVTVLYAGQMGRMHDVETLARAISAGIPFGLKLRFHASGYGYARLRAVVSDPLVEWGGSLDDLDWQEAMIAAQVALVTMTTGAEDVVMPSKAYSALVAGQAILAICPLKSDLADLVRKHDCGWVIAPGDAGSLCEVFSLIARDRALLHAKRLRAFEAGHRYYDSRVLAQQWLALFESIRPTMLK